MLTRLPTWLTRILGIGVLLAPALSNAQDPAPLPVPDERATLENPSQATQDKEASLIDEVIDAELIFTVDPARSKVVRTKLPIARLAVTNPSVVEVNEFGANEFEVIGLKSGETTLTIWFGNEGQPERIIRYLVRVAANEAEQERAEIEYGKLQSRINEIFPYSQIQLIPVADKLIVRGQVRDSQEAAQILAMLGGQSINQSGNLSGGGGLVTASNLVRLPGAEDLKTTTLVNLLHVPGEQQVMLKVRIAELTRNAAREMGMDFAIVKDSFSISNFIGGAGNLTAILDNGDIQLFMKAFSTNGYGKILAEPNLVTLSGQTATFLAGGQFAVPTAVGVDGIGAASTYFQGFGTQLTFQPTVIDKDKIRLHVAPSFSAVNNNNSVNDIPGLDVRSVTTTVDLREGQWLAIAGLIQDEQGGTRGRVPFIGDVPVLGAAFGDQNTSRNETELIVLVSPELVHPLEPDQAPTLLPGMRVTEPTDVGFYGLQRIEGMPEMHHRSPVWPAYQKQMQAAKWQANHQQSYYISGPHGFSE
jgi:pilus assembly protein CpaC